ncbi:hypothetical protein CPJCM30710_28480 [Clostridium polyendosporum]|uniref:Spore cortex biosynthesis protein YabQ n=1 Tax=Clostridium polyendosporum TaxID=69208 RepID=A0A919VHE7_9CLOT|nr:spore cortex biosynthesis protein YabQ [Clostridium polyendosporum]GIM30182.1 hypothetical protein CPJCM30710_28480 [Clostridium polyendosporum]
MLLPLSIQFRIVIYSIISGILTGILFDLYRVIRGINTPQFIQLIEDFLFWILCGIVIFIFLLYVNYAFLGPYVYVFLVLGILLYLRFVSVFFQRTEQKIRLGIFKFIRIFLKNLIYGLKVIFIGNKDNK